MKAVLAGYQRGIEQYAWALLLFAFIPGLLIGPVWVEPIFQIGVLLPIVIYIVINPGVLKNINKNDDKKAALVFTLFFVYTLLSVLWNSRGYSVNQFIFKCMGIYAVFILIFLICLYNEKKIPLIENLYLWIGTLCLMIAMWQSNMDIVFLDTLRVEGGYNYHVYISWLAATLGLILLARKSSLSALECVLLCFYIYSIIYSQSRGGLIALVCGYLFMLFLQDNPQREKKLILCVVLTLVFAFLFSPFSMKKMIGKQFGERPRIWEKNIREEAHTMPGLVIGLPDEATTAAKAKKNTREPRYQSLYLGLAHQGGVIALLLYGAMLLVVIYQGLRYATQTPWPYIVVGMSATMLVHGEAFFVDPSPLMTCLIIPLFMTLFIASNSYRNSHAG